MITLKVLPSNAFHKIILDSRLYFQVDFNQVDFKEEIIATMNHIEHTSNIEVQKLGVWCRKHKIRLTMLGALNQLPLMSTFADSAILRDDPARLDNIYDEEGMSEYAWYKRLKFAPSHKWASCCPSSMQHFGLPIELSVVNLCREKAMGKDPGYHIEDTTYWPPLLAKVANEISDEELVATFKDQTICIREEAFEKYQSLVDDKTIKKDLIMCEVKYVAHCDGAKLLNMFEQAIQKKNFSLPVCCGFPDRSLKNHLIDVCGQDYMSVQIMASLFDNWMWVCYGGSASLFVHFGVKLVSLSEAYNLPKIIRKFSEARFGELGKFFPEFDLLIYNLGEGGETPKKEEPNVCPNMDELIYEFSKLPVPYVIER